MLNIYIAMSVLLLTGAEVGALGAGPRGFVQHRVAGSVSFLSASRIRITGFSYDGLGVSMLIILITIGREVC